MDGEKQVGPGLIRNGCARCKRDKRVIPARVDDLRAQSFAQQSAQAQRHVEHNIFFFQTIRPQRAGVVAAVSGINHNAMNPQSQHTRH